MDFLAGYPVLPIQRSILSRPHRLPAPWLKTPSDRNVTNAPENIVRMKRRKIVTHYTDEREAMPVNWARCLEWSSSSSHSYANRTLLYTQAQWVFQVCRTETRASTPNARKHNDIVAAIVRDGQFSEETALMLSGVNGKVVTSRPCLLQMHMRRSS
jgi:hypothetical protein